jgi:hypothetical protein
VVTDLMPRGDGKAPVQLISFDNFKRRYANRYASAGSNPKQAGGWWLAHRQRRQYEDLILEPSKPDIVTEKGHQLFNLWRGWGVEPKRGDWPLMREHIRTILANSDLGFDSYIMNWSAFAVQHPSERAEVALTFKGKKGSGKTIFAQTLADFFGTQHGKVQSDPKRLTGQFNAFLRDTIPLGPGRNAVELAARR